MRAKGGRLVRTGYPGHRAAHAASNRDVVSGIGSIGGSHGADESKQSGYRLFSTEVGLPECTTEPSVRSLHNTAPMCAGLRRSGWPGWWSKAPGEGQCSRWSALQTRPTGEGCGSGWTLGQSQVGPTGSGSQVSCGAARSSGLLMPGRSVGRSARTALSAGLAMQSSSARSRVPDVVTGSS